jgi:dihydrodipicolinate synthase/N-acetylneuraminate lyase
MCRLEQRESLGVLDIPAAKVALSNTIEGFSATVRPPLLPATREQQHQLQEALKRLNSSKS